METLQKKSSNLGAVVVIVKKVKYMMSVNGGFKFYFDLLVMFLATYACLSIPYNVAFKQNLKKSISETVIDTFVTSIFVLDILLTFRTTYFDNFTGIEIADPK